LELENNVKKEKESSSQPAFTTQRECESVWFGGNESGADAINRTTHVRLSLGG